MALDLTGINNENEFFSQHYMDTLLERDLDSAAELPLSWDKVRSSWTRGVKDWTDDACLAKARAALAPIFENLGYSLKSEVRVIGDLEITVWTSLPGLLIIPTVSGTSPSADDELRDPLVQVIPGTDEITSESGVAESGIARSGAARERAEDTVSDIVFAPADAPRWVILTNVYQTVLIERGKWAHKRVLRFNWEEILGRRAPTTLRLVTGLLHKESLVPTSGQPILDKLDENSHKHAYGVSEDLKYALRESIELLGNEAIWYLKNVKREKVFGPASEGGLDEGQLSLECLRVMYRILFVFYLEARPELGYIPESGV